ncbi:hypoxia induced protein conserved region domain-containing protein [Sarocladium implicatum]|nr:hypoxia induced protein conserved region domain-containing protein [Sarocladium implicatum]
MADRVPTMPGQVPSSFDNNPQFSNERVLDKAVRKLKEEPLVPLGIGLTVFAFISAYRAIRRGDSQAANRMFRARVAAQGFTVVAMVAGSMYYSKDREKTKELRKLKEQKEAEETRNAWIRELEARDNEEKAMKARIQARKKEALAGKVVEEGATGAATEATGQEKGGILGRMGLWPAAEAKAAEQQEKQEEKKKDAEAAQKSEEEPRKGRRKNPNSSLGALSEVMGKPKAAKDRDAKDDESKGEEPENPKA